MISKVSSCKNVIKNVSKTFTEKKQSVKKYFYAICKLYLRTNNLSLYFSRDEIT